MTEAKPAPATIYAVAERAGVSIATVSRVLQGTNRVSSSTRDRVLEAARILDYLPRGSARALAAKKHEAIGFMVSGLTGPYFAELIIGFESAASELGFSVALLMTDSSGLSRPLRQLAARVDGLAVMIRPDQLAGEEIESLARHLPLVLVASGDHPHAIGTESVGSARELTEHLFAHGRRRLVFVGDPALASDAAERFAGFTAAHAAAGLTTPDPIRVGFAEADGRHVAQQLVSDRTDWPDALVCVNDEVAVAAMAELQRAGVRIPEDLAITGWDDVMTARYTRPRLTTVAQPVRELGRLAATTLTRIIADGTPAAGPNILPTRMVVRGSCGCREAAQLAPADANGSVQRSPGQDS